jgi:hypothetical protein
MANKKGILNIVNLICGLIIIAGGVSVFINYINLGLALAGLGILIEAIKMVLTHGLK